MTIESTKCELTEKDECLYEIAQPLLGKLDSLFIKNRSFYNNGITRETLDKIAPILDLIYYNSSHENGNSDESSPCVNCPKFKVKKEDEETKKS